MNKETAESKHNMFNPPFSKNIVIFLNMIDKHFP